VVQADAPGLQDGRHLRQQQAAGPFRSGSCGACSHHLRARRRCRQG
jgi:hypothetical protein